MTMTTSVRFTEQQFEQIRSALCSDSSMESACFAFCTQAAGEKGPMLVAQNLRMLRNEDYAVRARDRLSIKPAIMLSVARAAESGGRAICMMHVHPMSRGKVRFSLADDEGDARTHAFFTRIVPQVPHVSLVFDSILSVVDGRAFARGRLQDRVRVDVCGLSGQFAQCNSETTSRTRNRHSRQQRLVGDTGQAVLGNLSIVVVGLGGLGSLVSAGLVHSGVGSVLAIDSDRVVDETSLNRLLGASIGDSEEQSHKVRIAAAYAKALDPELEYEELTCRVEEPQILSRLVDADAIICCTDTTRSRAYLNQVCYQYSVPVLDLGCQFQLDPQTDSVVNEVGKINLVTPESACLVCTGHVYPDALYAESLSDDERRELTELGYVRGLVGPEPSMMMYNMQVAGLGLQRLLNHLIRIQPISANIYERLSFFGSGNRPYWKRVAKRRVSECVVCGEQSIVRGAGDSQAMLFSVSEAA